MSKRTFQPNNRRRSKLTVSVFVCVPVQVVPSFRHVVAEPHRTLSINLRLSCWLHDFNGEPAKELRLNHHVAKESATALSAGPSSLVRSGVRNGRRNVVLYARRRETEGLQGTGSVMVSEAVGIAVKGTSLNDR